MSQQENSPCREMTPRQKEIRFQVETELIEFFERRANE